MIFTYYKNYCFNVVVKIFNIIYNYVRAEFKTVVQMFFSSESHFLISFWLCCKYNCSILPFK